MSPAVRRASMRQPRRAMRFALQCELLESRQLLSIGQPGLASGLLLSSPFAGGHLSVPAAVSNFASTSSNVSSNASGFSVQIVFASFGGLNLEIAFFGGGQLFSPTPGPSFSPAGGGSSSGGSGFSLGTLPGSLGNSGTGSLGITGDGTGQTGFGLNLGSSTASITPLNPAASSILNTPGAPVYVVPPPLAALAVHLGASTAPATAISNSTLISNLDEQPPITHFGQGDIVDGRRFFTQTIQIAPETSSLTDYIEPYRVVVPAAAPEGQAPQGEQAPAPATPKAPLLPPVTDPNIDDALDFTDDRVLTRSRDGDLSQSADEFSHSNTSWSFSAIFGAAAVATGGYHLVLREADRMRGRWIPRWSGSERPFKRRTGSPPR